MSPTRRAYLRAGVAAGVAALAGCASQSSDGPAETDGTSTRGSSDEFFEGISFEGGDLVVALASDHGLSGVNLIAPDGTIFEQATVATGVRTVRLPVLDPQPDDGGYRHYTPGVHELVGVSVDNEEVGSVEIPMEPEIELVEIEQYRTGDRPSDLGSLVVTVENTGTAPTWVYDITYREAPNFAADTALGNNPGILSVRTISEAGSMIVGPDMRNSYRDATSPLLFNRENRTSCSGLIDFSVLIAAAYGDVVEAQVTGSADGEALSVGLVDEYACSEVDITVVSNKSDIVARMTTANKS